MNSHIFLFRILPILCLEILLAVFSWVHLERDFRQKLILHQKNRLAIQRTLFESALDLTLGDSVILASSAVYHLGGPDPAEKDILAMTQEMLAFSDQRGVYDQVRFLDLTGEEVIRVNRSSQGAIAVPGWELKNKASRYYFQKSSRLDTGVYVSQFDLNVEHGKVEVPYKPVIRMARQVFTPTECLGVVVINFMGANLLQKLQSAMSPELGRLYLVNESGGWILGPTMKDDWAFMFQDKQERTMPSAFPEAWTQLQAALFPKGRGSAETSYAVIQTPGGIFSAQRVEAFSSSESEMRSAPHTGMAEEDWVLMLHAPPEAMRSGWEPLLFTGTLGVMCLSAVMVWGWSSSIAERRASALALQRSEEQHRLLFENMANGVALLEYVPGKDSGEDDMRFLNCNAAYERLTDVKATDLRGRFLREIFAGRGQANAAELVARYKAVALGRQPVRFEYTSKTHPRQYEVLAYSPERGHCAVILNDVTSRKLAEERMREAKDAAEVASAIKSQFLANMSHEVRTPLNGILGILQLLQDIAADEEQEEYILTAIASATRLSDLLADIMDLTKMETGSAALHPVSFDMRSNVPLILQELFSKKLEEKQLGFHVQVDPRIPDVLLGDATRLHKVLFNLVGNAVKFTDKGSVSVDISLLSPPGASPCKVLFSISDTGEGIPESHLATIFTPFTQVDESLTKTHQGAGLGLAIVKRIVALWGGELCVDSEPGQGSAFHVVLTFEVDMSQTQKEVDASI